MTEIKNHTQGQPIEPIEKTRVYVHKDVLKYLELYQEIGTISQLGALKEERDKYFLEIQAYRAIGTVEQCKSAVERMKPRKVVYREQSYGTPWLCPVCESDQVKVEFFCEDGSEPKEKYTYCWSCGSCIDWSE